MNIWLIRHGLTKLGEEGRYQGALDIGLSENGRTALRKAEFEPERVYVSPMLRARETAEILFPDAEQVVVSALREMNFGVFEGRSAQEMERDEDYCAWVEGGCRGRCPGGESLEEFSSRVCTAFEGLLQTGEELAIVAHGGTMMAILSEQGEPERLYWQWQRPCGCGWLLRYDRPDRKLRVLEEVSFLR
jgi:alpha-ribazole phosphatase